MQLQQFKKDIQKCADPEKGKFLQRFFKTGKGQYGEGDVFAGLTVPQARRLATQYKTLPEKDVITLLHSPIHEERMIALFILTFQFEAGDAKEKKEIYDRYLENTAYINNWDLVDCSAAKIVGNYLWEKKDRSILIRLAHSKSLWERRIAIIATLYFIVKGEEADTFRIADILLHDPHDLIQKAVGWMLREVGKRVSQQKLIDFLQPRYQTMPRTMLRYAIEHFPKETRKKYLLGII